MKTLQSCPGLTTKQWDLVDQQKNIPPEQWTRAHDREVCFQQKERQNFPRDLGGVSFLPIWASFLTKSYWIAKEIHLAQPLPLTQYTQKSHPWLKEKENKKSRRVTSFHSLQRIILLWAAVLSWHWDSSTDLVWAGRHACPDSAWPMPLRSSASFSSLLLWEARPELLHSPSQPLRREYSLSCKKGNEIIKGQKISRQEVGLGRLFK